MRGIYPLARSPRCSLIRFPSHSGHWGTRRCSQVRLAKCLALAGFGTPVELDPFSQKLTTLRFLRRGDNAKSPWQRGEDGTEFKLHIIYVKPLLSFPGVSL